MDLIGGIFILAVASLILTSICVGFIICGVLVLWRRDERKPKGMTGEEKPTGPNIDTPQSAQMPQDSKDVQSQLAQLSKAVSDMARQSGEMHKWAQSRGLSNTGLAVIGLGLATIGIAYASAIPPQPVNPDIAISGIVFILSGFLLQVASNFWPRKPKLK